MASATLSATLRDTAGKGVARALRRDGRVPAVIYGHNREAQSLSLETRAIDRLLEHIATGGTVVELSLDGRTVRTLIREVQRHPLKRHILHVDFQELVAGETVTTKVPLVFIGIPDGVRVDGGVLEEVLHELNISVDPANLPNHIDIDVTSMAVASTLHVSDLTLPAGVTVLDDESLTVAVVQPPRVAEPTPEVAPAEPEVLRKAKTDEE